MTRAAVCILVLSMPAWAQWLDYPTPGIPRTPGGKPRLSAPAPRTADGKPDLSGIWEHMNSRTTAYYLDGIDIPWQPWAAALFKKNTDDNQIDNPESRCLPRGIPKADAFDTHKIMGYSVGRWEGDTLVVESSGFNGKAWLSGRGNPTSDAMHLTERIRRRDMGHMDIQLTIDDPKAYTKPWKAELHPELIPDTELIEFVCNENERDLRHLVGK